MTDFSKLKEGDKVWSILRGWGAVTGEGGDPYYPLAVSYGLYQIHYTAEGKNHKNHDFPELYLTEQVINDRPREINWTKIPVDTKVVVSDDGLRYYDRYFLAYLPARGSKFIVFTEKPTQENATDTSTWLQCELRPSVEILHEWYLSEGDL